MNKGKRKVKLRPWKVLYLAHKKNKATSFVIRRDGDLLRLTLELLKDSRMPYTLVQYNSRGDAEERIIFSPKIYSQEALRRIGE